MSLLSTSSCHSWMDTPRPRRGLCDTYAAAMLKRRLPGWEWGRAHRTRCALHGECVCLLECESMLHLYVCISVFMYREQEQGRAQLPKPKYIERRGKQEEGEIQNSREQLADEVTRCVLGGGRANMAVVQSRSSCIFRFGCAPPILCLL